MRGHSPYDGEASLTVTWTAHPSIDLTEQSLAQLRRDDSEHEPLALKIDRMLLLSDSDAETTTGGEVRTQSG